MCGDTYTTYEGVSVKRHSHSLTSSWCSTQSALFARGPLSPSFQPNYYHLNLLANQLKCECEEDDYYFCPSVVTKAVTPGECPKRRKDERITVDGFCENCRAVWFEDIGYVKDNNGEWVRGSAYKFGESTRFEKRKREPLEPRKPHSLEDSKRVHKARLQAKRGERIHHGSL